jgi:hypothetical protein
MRRQLTVLLLLSSCTVLYAQDTLAVIQTKYKPRHSNVFFLGDTVLLELITESFQAGRIQSMHGWYHDGKKIANVNLQNLQSELLDIQTSGDTIYYYGYDNRGKTSNIKVLYSIGFDSTIEKKGHDIEGTVLGATRRNGKISVVSFNRKKKTAYVYDLQSGRLKEAGSLTLPWNIESVPNKQIVLVSSHPRNITGEGLKFFLQNNTLGVVFDDRFQTTGDTKTFQRTLVIRKDLTIDKMEADGFRMDEHGPFISYLDGNFLYRLTPRDELIIQDLDSNKVDYRLKLADITQTEIFRRNGSSTEIRKANNDDRMFDRSHSLDVAMAMDNFGDQKVLTLRYFVEEKKGFPMFLPVPVGNVTLFIGTRPVHYYSSYEYLIGTPAKGFIPVSKDLKFPKLLADRHDLATSGNASRDYTSYSLVKDYVVVTYGIAKSPVILFVKFPGSPD